MSDIHSCSYVCHIPACIKAQRDELRDKRYAALSVEEVMALVDQCKADWNAQADEDNQWSELYRREIGLLVCRAVEKHHGITGETE